MAALTRALCALVLLLVAFVPADAAARTKPAVEYEVSIPQPHTQYVEVSATIDKVRRKTTDVAMPAWTPGSYKIRDFARHVYGWKAETLDGQPLPVSRVDKQTWRVENKRKPFRFSYRIWADELGVRTSYADDKMAFLNGASVFVYVVGQTDRPAKVTVKSADNWPVHTTMPREGETYSAANYDQLVDQPLLLGNATVKSWTVDNTRFDYVFLAPAGSNADVDRLAADAEKIVTAAGEIMGGFPFEHYAFLIVADPVGGGGLEHANSTGIILPPFIFDDEAGYSRAQRVAAHEFFHAWNVKRIHDKQLGPFDYANEVYSPLLWFHEGVTTTMTSRLLLHAGLLTPDEYLDGIASSWTSYAKLPGRNAEPISQLSRDAWIKGYQPSSNHRNDAVSYYTKGNILGVALDLELHLRAEKHDRTGSIEGLLKRLWDTRKKHADERPITPDDLIQAASEEAGEDMSEFFARYVDGTQEIPLPSLLERAGLKVDRKKPAEQNEQAWTGIHGYGSKVSSVEPGSPAANAGLMVDDEIIAVDSLRVDGTSEAKTRMGVGGPGAKHDVTLFRRGRLEQRELTTVETPYETLKVKAGETKSWPVPPATLGK